METDLSLPPLSPGQVLIKLAATSIGPADLMFLKGEYGITKRLPVVPGFEGSGTVIASGGGLMARELIGKRVACLAPEDGRGTWAEYMVTSTDICIPLSKDISFEQGAYLAINPMTALALVEIARTGGHVAFVQTAAASTLGLMIARLAERFRLTGIHIVRRPEQARKLNSLGCEHVLTAMTHRFRKAWRKPAINSKQRSPLMPWAASSPAISPWPCRRNRASWFMVRSRTNRAGSIRRISSSETKNSKMAVPVD
jgi:NADPH:quinone reductase-like Zn-dependent oxidoreductase